MLTGSDLTTNLAEAVAPAQTSLKVADIGDLGAKLVSGSHAYIMLDDGVQSEIVKATAASGGAITVVRAQFGTTAKSFVAGVCAKPYTGINFLCELFSQGGCTMGTTVACTPVSLATESLPDAVVGKPWVGVVAFANATTVTAVTKPSWATATVTGSTLILKGTPTSAFAIANAPIVVRADGCNSSISVVNSKLQVCSQVSVA